MRWGRLPDWGTDDLPEPLPFSFRNALRTIGPGAILLAGSIGGGEWLVGPAAAVKHGPGLMWMATVGIALQVLLNLEAIRYTLYTGEPVFSGIMRLRPGSKFWGSAYVLLAAAQLATPAVGLASATVLFAAFAGRLPGESAGAGDGTWLVLVAWAVIVGSALLLTFGGTIEKTLERLSWGMIAFIFAFLIAVNVLFVPVGHWLRTLTGFVSFGTVPDDADLLLVASLAAMAGSGGVGNLGISNWVRDKGWGMGARTGAIAAAFGGREVRLSHTGKVFPVTPENLRRWHVWWRYVRADQVWLWALGCFLGMYLNVNLATAITPPGEGLEGMAAGAYQAEYMTKQFWSGFWILMLINGFWILFSTHLGNTDLLVRTATDILWVGSDRLRRPGHSVTRVYYTLLAGFTVWGIVSVTWGDAMELFKTLGTIAGFITALAAVQILRVNTRLLPPELRPALWRRAGLVLCAAFYLVVCGAAVWGELRKAWLVSVD